MASMNGSSFLNQPGMSGSSPTVDALGLGSKVGQDLADEDAKRKKLLEDMLKNNTSLTEGGIMSPATMALFSA